MKRFFSLILVLIMTFALCACEKAAEPTKTCYLEIRCDDALAFEELSAEKRELLPADGAILAKCEVKFSEGESVYDVVLRVLKENKVHYDADTASKYFKGIGNLYSFDCGEYSGWSYYVNDELPMIGMADYKLSEDNEILLTYITEFEV